MEFLVAFSAGAFLGFLVGVLFTMFVQDTRGKR